MAERMSDDAPAPAPRFRSCRRGATAIEYALIAAVLASLIVAGLTSLGGSLGTTFGEIGNRISAQFP